MKSNLKTNRILSISAFVISTATLIALMYQSHLAREQNNMIKKQQYASVMPYLVMGFMATVDDSRFDLFVKNKGVGPAFIKDINIWYNDSLYKMSVVEFYTKILKIKNKNNIKILRSDIKKSSVLTVGEQVPLLSFFTNQEEALELLDAFVTMKATIEITYASIYDQKWKLKNPREPHIPIQ